MNIKVLANNPHFMYCEELSKEDLKKGYPVSKIHDCPNCDVVNQCSEGEMVYTEIEEDYILYSAIKKYGIEAQKGMVIEEIGEFLQAWNKTERNSDDPEKTMEEFIEELVDLKIMIKQMYIYYERNGSTRVKRDKLLKLAKKIGLCSDETDYYGEISEIAERR